MKVFNANPSLDAGSIGDSIYFFSLCYWLKGISSPRNPALRFPRSVGVFKFESITTTLISFTERYNDASDRAAKIRQDVEDGDPDGDEDDDEGEFSCLLARNVDAHAIASRR
jgi:hypothetical protein